MDRTDKINLLEKKTVSSPPRPIPEKARLLRRLREGHFNVPDFIYVPAEDFRREDFDALRNFFAAYSESFKVIARSAHPLEAHYKGGTFDSLETYADVGGIVYARKRIIRTAMTAKRLSILRQRRFNNAPELDPEEMGVVVMPFIEGINVMAKLLGDHWEFGYLHRRSHKLTVEPHITRTPHDRRLLEISEDIQRHLGFPCEIEYIIGEDGEIYVVQAKDISGVDTLEMSRAVRSIRLDGVRRIRRRRNYRERPVYVMDKKSFFIEIIGMCEDILMGGKSPDSVEEIISFIRLHEEEFEDFALRHENFGVLGLSLEVPSDLFQIAFHYLDEYPELQARISKALYQDIYRTDYFLAEADTLIARDRVRVNLGTHDAYGIDTLRNPIWSVYWNRTRHRGILQEIRRLGFKTGDCVAVEIDAQDKPTIHRL